MEHELKIWPKFFDAVRRGDKPFEVRKNDRNFYVGDTLVLREFEPGTHALGQTPATTGHYTGRSTEKVVIYVLPGGNWGIQDGYVVLGIR